MKVVQMEIDLRTYNILKQYTEAFLSKKLSDKACAIMLIHTSQKHLQLGAWLGGRANEPGPEF